MGAVRMVAGIALLGVPVTGAAQDLPVELVPDPSPNPAEPALPIDDVGGVLLPGVPPGISDPAGPGGVGLTPEGVDASLYTDTRITITVQEGTTELIYISRGYLNRIVTPFEDPKLVTVNTLQFRKEGSSVFLSASGEAPVGVHILSNDPLDTRSISLALVPRPIPPRTIELRWPTQTMDPVVARITAARAARWEESQPYVDGVMELFGMLARGEVPPGYALMGANDGVSCEIPGLTLDVGQQLLGSHFTVYVFLASNPGPEGVEILQHAGCMSSRVLAVAPWPRAYLGPGESTELFVAVTNAPEIEPVDNPRPSLLSVVSE